jgi:hypothetical protein
MPNSDTICATVPIPIDYVKSNYSFSDFGKPNKSYLFNLLIILKNNKIRQFNKIEKKQKSSIFGVNENIHYDDMIGFKFTFSEIPTNDETEFTIEGDINHIYSSFEINTDKLYLEFSKSQTGKAMCSTYIIENIGSILSISPN